MNDTIWTLAALNERDFDRRTTVLEAHADQGDMDAYELLKQVDDVIEAVGTFDPELVAPCKFTFSHTRWWCGNVTCRNA